MASSKPLKAVLGDNIATLRAAKTLSQPAVAAAAKHAGHVIGQTTVGRIERAVHAADVDTIEAISKGLGVEAWQLLVPALKAEQLPELGADLTKDEAQLLADYRKASDGWRLTVRLIARTPPEEQPKLSRDMNILMTAIFDSTPATNKRVEETYGFPPGSKPPTLHEPAPGERPGNSKK